MESIFSSATKYCIFCPVIFFFTLTNSVYPDEMPHGGISPVYKSKNSKLGCKDQESIQSSTTPDPG